MDCNFLNQVKKRFDESLKEKRKRTIEIKNELTNRAGLIILHIRTGHDHL